MRGGRIAFLTGVGMLGLCSGAQAGCLSHDGDGRFYNNCGEKVIFTFRTIGGGCFERGYGSETASAGGSVKTAANFSCNGRRPARVEWVWCGYDAWTKGRCATRFND